MAAFGYLAAADLHYVARGSLSPAKAQLQSEREVHSTEVSELFRVAQQVRGRARTRARCEKQPDTARKISL